MNTRFSSWKSRLGVGTALTFVALLSACINDTTPAPPAVTDDDPGPPLLGAGEGDLLFCYSDGQTTVEYDFDTVGEIFASGTMTVKSTDISKTCTLDVQGNWTQQASTATMTLSTSTASCVIEGTVHLEGNVSPTPGVPILLLSSNDCSTQPCNTSFSLTGTSGSFAGEVMFAGTYQHVDCPLP